MGVWGKKPAAPTPYDLVWGDGVVPSILFGMTALFMVLHPILRTMFPRTMRARGAFLLAFELSCLFPLAYCAYEGYTTWTTGLGAFTTAKARLYATSPGAMRVLQAHLAFEAWDFGVSFFNKTLRAPEMLAHHALAALLCYWALTMPYMHYYAVYFMGVAEISSVPLVLVDAGKYYPDVSKRFPGVDLAAKLTFLACFVLVRDVFWVLTAIEVWKDGLAVLAAGNFPAKYPGYVTASVLLTNVFFSALQVLWTGKLARGVYHLFTPKAPPRADAPAAVADVDAKKRE